MLALENVSSIDLAPVYRGIERKNTHWNARLVKKCHPIERNNAAEAVPDDVYFADRATTLDLLLKLCCRGVNVLSCVTDLVPSLALC